MIPAPARLPLAAAAVFALLAGDMVASAQKQDGQQATPQQVVLRVGDTMTVEGAGIGCQVSRRDGAVAVECHKGGHLAGSYMSVMTRRKAMLARYRSTDTAKVVVTAPHRGKLRVCRSSATTAGIAGVCR